MDGLLSAAVLIRGVLTAAQDALGDKTTLIVLDDFYHVPFADQRTSCRAASWASPSSTRTRSGAWSPRF